MTLRHWRTFALVALALELFALAGCETLAALPLPGTHSPTPTPYLQIKDNGLGIVSAEGSVVPIQRATLALRISGQVTEVRVADGDEVKAGDVLLRLDDELLQKQILHSEAELTVAKKHLEQLRSGGTPSQRQAAQDALISARSNYSKVKVGPTQDELAQLKANLDSTKAAVDRAQSAYDRIGGDANPFAGAAPERLALQQAWNAYTAAQAAWRDAANHPTESELKAAAAAVAQAESAVATLDPSPQALALAEAQVERAQAALEIVRASAKEAVLRAPFAGTIAQVNLHLGDFASPGTPAIIIGDLSKLRVETTDLSEADVAKVKVGQPAEVTLDAFPDQTFHGTVSRMAPYANESRGDKVFRVWIDLKEGIETGLHWGMVANVEIAVGANGAQK